MFRKGLSCLTILSFLLAPAWCLTDPPVQTPKAVLTEHAFEFQPVLEGTQIAHRFILKNEGEVPLNILKISSG